MNWRAERSATLAFMQRTADGHRAAAEKGNDPDRQSTARASFLALDAAATAIAAGLHIPDRKPKARDGSER